MTLDEVIAAEGAGAINRLAAAAQVSLPVIARARKGRASLSSATKLSRATGGRVRISSMTFEIVPTELERPARRKLARSKRRKVAA